MFSEDIDQFRGRVVNAPADSILAEFGSVVDAVGDATEFQWELPEGNTDLLEERKINLRIGLNLGDVMVRAAIEPWMPDV